MPTDSNGDLIDNEVTVRYYANREMSWTFEHWGVTSKSVQTGLTTCDWNVDWDYRFEYNMLPDDLLDFEADVVEI